MMGRAASRQISEERLFLSSASSAAINLTFSRLNSSRQQKYLSLVIVGNREPDVKADDELQIEGDSKFIQKFFTELFAPFFTQANTSDTQTGGGPAYMVARYFLR